MKNEDYKWDTPENNERMKNFLYGGVEGWEWLGPGIGWRHESRVVGIKGEPTEEELEMEGKLRGVGIASGALKLALWKAGNAAK